ncbi:MAG: hypothetical protein QOD75_320 [Blastocatellia bacterium]|jgi:hypothetical protein|nr:hypothetical protein [Blastocatellia bacterium]
MDRINKLGGHQDRRDFLSLAGKGLGLAALSSVTAGTLLKEVQAVTKHIAHRSD